MSVFELWALFVALPNFVALSELILGLLCAMLIVTALIFIITEGEGWDGIKIFFKKFRVVLIGLLLLGILGTFSPNEKQVALIIGGTIATNTEGVEKLPENLVKAANSFLERVQTEE